MDARTCLWLSQFQDFSTRLALIPVGNPGQTMPNTLMAPMNSKQGLPRFQPSTLTSAKFATGLSEIFAGYLPITSQEAKSYRRCFDSPDPNRVRQASPNAPSEKIAIDAGSGTAADALAVNVPGKTVLLPLVLVATITRFPAVVWRG